MSPSFKNTLLGLVVLSVLFLVIERVFGRARGPLLRRGWLTDVAYWFLTPFVTCQFNTSVARKKSK